HDEGVPVVVLDAVDGADIRMVQLGGSTRFAREAFERLRIANQVFRDELQCDVAAQLEVFGLIHHAHTTAPELAKNAVMGDLLADHERARPCPAVMLGCPPIPVNSHVSADIAMEGGRGTRTTASAQPCCNIKDLRFIPKSASPTTFCMMPVACGSVERDYDEGRTVFFIG